MSPDLPVARYSQVSAILGETRAFVGDLPKAGELAYAQVTTRITHFGLTALAS